MLILKRKIQEFIQIDENITIKILEVSDNQVKLGIEAPREVTILRGELVENVKENIKNASKSVVELNIPLDKLNINKINKKKKDD